MTVLMALLLGVALQGAADRTDYVSFCEIVQHPERYDQKSVLTTGIYRAGPELSDFIDPDCAPTSDNDLATFPTTFRRSVHDTKGWKRMNQILDRDNQAFIVVRAVFDASNPNKVPLPADPRLHKFFEAPGRFGHLDFARFQLRIERVEFAAPVSK